MADSEPALSYEEKDAIRGYLLKLISVPAILLTVGSFVVGFLVDKGATQQAYLEAFSKVNAIATQELFKTNSLATQDIIRATQITAKAVESAETAKRQVDHLLADIQKVQTVANALRDSTKVAEETSLRLTKDPNFVASVIGSIGTAGTSKTVGYGAGVHVNRELASRCPIGHYVTAVEVVYGGTCDRRCDQDGGVVKEIRVVCQTFGAK